MKSSCPVCKHPVSYHGDGGCHFRDGEEDPFCPCGYSIYNLERVYRDIAEMKRIALWWAFTLALTLITVGIAAIVGNLL